MAELTARHLMSHRVKRLLVANRTLDHAIELDRRLQGQGIALADMPSHLPQADIVISSTGAPAPLIGPAEAQRALRQRKNRPTFFIDIAVPRDIDPGINDLDNVYLYDIDDLQHRVGGDLKDPRHGAHPQSFSPGTYRPHQDLGRHTHAMPWPAMGLLEYRWQALSTYCLWTYPSARKVEDPHRSRYLRSREPCHFLPALEALDHLFSIGPGGKAVASREEMLGSGPIRGEESLGVPRGFEALHHES